MQGTVLQFQAETNSGFISGYDGVRYTFARLDWTNSKVEPKPGMIIDFEPEDKKAKSIILIKSNKPKKRKLWVFAWLLTLGPFGAHRFYLGEKGAGLFYLLLCWTGIPLFLCICELFYFAFISAERFDEKYNQ